MRLDGANKHWSLVFLSFKKYFLRFQPTGAFIYTWSAGNLRGVCVLTWKYAQTVGPAYEGAVTQPGAKKETHTYADI